jgi:deoxyribodipyrimidine photolyase-related protein
MRVLWLQDIHLNRQWLESLELDKEQDLILFCEAQERYTWQPFHKQKLVMHLSAQRHYAAALHDAGYRVLLVPGKTFSQCLSDVVAKEIDIAKVEQWIIVLPTDHMWRKSIQSAVDNQIKIHSVHYIEDDFLYLVPSEHWPRLLPSQKKWKMEPVYQKLRKQFHVMMDGDAPVGGAWNFDSLNRKPANEHYVFVESLQFPADLITNHVIQLVEHEYADHPGILNEFLWPVTTEQAYQALDHFIENRLADFGAYQDAMVGGNPFMAHSLISAAMNIGLIHPLDAIQKAEVAFRSQLVTISSAEGFIRQIIGWREYVRGVYICAGEKYDQSNFFECERALPALYWGGQTQMNCLRTVIQELLQSGYSHHIQRLMVLCNFATLTGIRPQEVNDWFHQMYIDSQDWVVTPNVIGMGLYADGGLMATKPYVSSAQYIKKMSNYCDGCTYSPNQRTGENACPFNALYWSFIATHQNKLQSNHRMQMMIGTWRKFSLEEQAKIVEQSKNALEKLDLGQL